VGVGAVVAATTTADGSPAGGDAAWPQPARARATRDRRSTPGSHGLALWKMVSRWVEITDHAP
jgi:hypothetical protein